MRRIDEGIHVAIKSYARAGKVTTHEVMPFAHVWVPESQGDEYREHHGDKVITIPDDADGNLCRKSNAILDRSPEDWTLIVDDDITAIRRFQDSVSSTLEPDEVAAMIEHGFDLASQFGVRLWGVNQNSDEMAYKPCLPFSTLRPVLGPFLGHLDPVLRFDEDVWGKDDYDFFLQNIHRHRKVLRLNRYHYIHDHGEMEGGFVSMRTMRRELAGARRLVEKWGSKVYRVGGSPGARRDRSSTPTGNVLNSLIKVPIPGV